MEWDLDGNNEEEEVNDPQEFENIVVEKAQPRKGAATKASAKKEEDMFILERVQWR
jgi:hypothetical protein